jgi:hypothetical protein
LFLKGWKNENQKLSGNTGSRYYGWIGSFGRLQEERGASAITGRTEHNNGASSLNQIAKLN